MNQSQTSNSAYYCPMHTDVRQSTAGKCPKCGMDLVAEGARFGMLQHIAKNPWMLIAMILIMLVAMFAVAMMR